MFPQLSRESHPDQPSQIATERSKRTPPPISRK